MLSHGAAERLRNAALFLAIMPGKGYTLLNFEIPVYPKVVGAFPDQQLHVGVLEFKNLDNHPGSKKLPASVLDRSYEYALDFPVTQYDEISSWCVIKSELTHDAVSGPVRQSGNTLILIKKADLGNLRSGGTPCNYP